MVNYKYKLSANIVRVAKELVQARQQHDDSPLASEKAKKVLEQVKRGFIQERESLNKVDYELKATFLAQAAKKILIDDLESKLAGYSDDLKLAQEEVTINGKDVSKWKDTASSLFEQGKYVGQKSLVLDLKAQHPSASLEVPIQLPLLVGEVKGMLKETWEADMTVKFQSLYHEDNTT